MKVSKTPEPLHAFVGNKRLQKFEAVQVHCKRLLMNAGGYGTEEMRSRVTAMAKAAFTKKIPQLTSKYNPEPVKKQKHGQEKKRDNKNPKSGVG